MEQEGKENKEEGNGRTTKTGDLLVLVLFYLFDFYLFLKNESILITFKRERTVDER